MKKTLSTLLGASVLLVAPVLALSSFSSNAASFEVQVELPTMDVAEYHAPYVAMWLQSSDKTVTNLALWYDKDMRNDEGQQWLKDIRQWWRRSGRSLSLPADGITGATRKAGSHKIDFAPLKTELAKLPAGDYEFFIEVVREVGGREITSIPFSLLVTSAQNFSEKGSSELAQVSLTVTP